MLSYQFACTVSPRKVVIYPKRGRSKRIGNARNFTKKHTPKGSLSAISIRKMKKAIEMLEAISEKKKSFNDGRQGFWSWKLNFITLTLPAPQGNVDDASFRRNYLNHFFTLLRRKWNPKGYVWRLEAQANGNIHVHLVTDKFIHHEELRRTWNQVLSKGHFIKDYQKKFSSMSKEEYILDYQLKNKKSREKAEKAYDKGKSDNWLNPNTTDVHSTYGISNCVNYLGKYLSKGDGRKLWLKDNIAKLEFQPVWAEVKRAILWQQNDTRTYRTVEGKLWGCSENLMDKKGIKGDWDDGDESYMESAVTAGKIGRFDGSFFRIYYQQKDPFMQYLPPYYRLRLREYIAELRSGSPGLFPILDEYIVFADRSENQEFHRKAEAVVKVQQLKCPF